MLRTARICLTTFGFACLAAAGASSALASTPPRGPLPPGRAVFVMNDRPAGNQVIAYSRAEDGTLTQEGVYDTGGLGGQLEGSVVDHTASQGGLALDRTDRLLFAVNPGSDSLSVFSVAGDALRLRQVLPSGGAFPVSVTESEGYVYVLNAGQGGSIRGFVLAGGTLYPNPGARRALSLPQATPGSGEQFTHTPAQIGFTPDGSRLVITTKAAGQSVEVFTAHTLAPVPVTTSLPGAVPFGFTFDPAGRLLVSEAGPNALASFSWALNNRLTPRVGGGHRTGRHLLGGSRGRLLLRLERRQRVGDGLLRAARRRADQDRQHEYPPRDGRRRLRRQLPVRPGRRPKGHSTSTKCSPAARSPASARWWCPKRSAVRASWRAEQRIRCPSWAASS